MATADRYRFVCVDIVVPAHKEIRFLDLSFRHIKLVTCSH